MEGIDLSGVLRNPVAQGFGMKFHVRENPQFPGACEIWLQDLFCARISPPGATEIIANAMGLRNLHAAGPELEATFLIGILMGLQLPKPIRKPMAEALRGG